MCVCGAVASKERGSFLCELVVTPGKHLIIGRLRRSWKEARKSSSRRLDGSRLVSVLLGRLHSTDPPALAATWERRLRARN